MITYDNKDKTLPTSNPRRIWRDVDANEVKTVVNANELAMLQILRDAETTGTNDYEAAPNPSTGGVYGDQTRFQIKFTNASTGASTLALNGGAAKKLYKSPTEQVGGGDIPANLIAIVVYDAALDSGAGGFLLIGGVGGGVEHFLGLYASEGALTSAHPTADPGDYAYVDAGTSSDVELYIWDDDDAQWVSVGNVTVSAWTETDPGTVERSTTSEAQNIVTRAAAGSSDSSNSDARTPSEKGLVGMLLSFLSTAWTWASQQTFSFGPIISDATASVIAAFDASKKLVSVAYAVASDIITGTDAVKPVTSAAIKGFRDLVAATPSLSGSDLTCNCSDKQESAFYYATLTGNANVIFSSKSNSQVHHLVIAITGASIVLTFESDVRMARYMEAVQWDQASKQLNVSSIGTGDLHEFSFVRAGSVFIMRYDGPVRA